MTENNNLADTWTITIETTVFAGDMDEASVKENAERLLDDLLDGTDFTGWTIIKTERNTL